MWAWPFLKYLTGTVHLFMSTKQDLPTDLSQPTVEFRRFSSPSSQPPYKLTCFLINLTSKDFIFINIYISPHKIHNALSKIINIQWTQYVQINHLTIFVWLVLTHCLLFKFWEQFSYKKYLQNSNSMPHYSNGSNYHFNTR